MKEKLRTVFDIIRNHKVFTGAIAVGLVAVIITTVAACVTTKRSTESYAVSAVSENTVSSSTVSSSPSAVPSVTSSVPSLTSTSTSTPTTSTATKASTAPATSAKQTSSAVTPKVKTSSRKSSITASKVATSKTSTASTKTSSTTTTNPLYVAIPQSQELKYLSIAGGQLVLNVNAFTLTGYVSSADEQQYIGDDAYYSVTEKSTGKVMISGQNGAVANNNQIGVATPLVTYEHGNDYWLKPATYTVHVWCQKSDTSKNTTAGRPQKVDICTFTVSVNERGFK